MPSQALSQPDRDEIQKKLYLVKRKLAQAAAQNVAQPQYSVENDDEEQEAVDAEAVSPQQASPISEKAAKIRRFMNRFRYGAPSRRENDENDDERAETSDNSRRRRKLEFTSAEVEEEEVKNSMEFDYEQQQQTSFYDTSADISSMSQDEERTRHSLESDEIETEVDRSILELDPLLMDSIDLKIQKLNLMTDMTLEKLADDGQMQMDANAMLQQEDEINTRIQQILQGNGNTKASKNRTSKSVEQSLDGRDNDDDVELARLIQRQKALEMDELLIPNVDVLDTFDSDLPPFDGPSIRDSVSILDENEWESEDVPIPVRTSWSSPKASVSTPVRESKHDRKQHDSTWLDSLVKDVVHEQLDYVLSTKKLWTPFKFSVQERENG